MTSVEASANRTLDNHRWAFPFPLTRGQPDPLSAEQARRWIWILVGLSVSARLIRYGLRLPLWADEAFLSANFLDRGYLDFFRPLEYHQVGPLLFLWAQLTAVKLLGFTEYSLRLFPLLSGLASLWIYVHVARRLFVGMALVAAVAIFACSYPTLRYAVEAKPYGCDLLVAVVMLALVVEWLRTPEQLRWLWILAAMAPGCIGLSYPAMFVSGGLSLTVAAAIWRNRATRAWLPWVIWNASLAVSALALYFLCIRSQSGADLEAMQRLWGTAFPPLGSLWKFAKWMIGVHTGEMLAHPIGGPNGGSVLTFLGVVTAAMVLWQRRQRILLLACVAPLAFNFVAAAMWRYPYATQVRIAMFMTPAVSLLAGLGLAVLLARLAARRGTDPTRALAVVLVLMAAIPLGSVVRDFAFPGKTKSDIRARDFARWFWFELSHDAELVCLKSDLHQDFTPMDFEWGFSSIYLCNQRIYSPRHARHQPPRWDLVSADHPLRCVEYRTLGYPRDERAFAQWLDQMQTRYDLVTRKTYPVRHFASRDPSSVDQGLLTVLEFVPKGSAKAR